MSTVNLPISTIEKIERRLEKALEEVRALKRAKTQKTGERPEIPSARLIKAIKRAERNLKEGKHSPVFDNAEDAIAWLHRDE